MTLYHFYLNKKTMLLISRKRKFKIVIRLTFRLMRSSFEDLIRVAFPRLSSLKLMETGFKYENGLQEMFDGAIQSCKRMGIV